MILWIIQQRYKDSDEWEAHEDGLTTKESLARARYTLLVEEQADWIERNGSGLNRVYRLLRCEVVETTE